MLELRYFVEKRGKIAMLMGLLTVESTQLAIHAENSLFLRV